MDAAVVSDYCFWCCTIDISTKCVLLVCVCATNVKLLADVKTNEGP